MKRIARNRCGYDGYKCRPIPKLNPLFKNTYTDIYAVEKIKEALDSEFNSAWVGPDQYDPDMLVGTIDNYAQLPQQFEGFIMTLAPIINMEGEPGPFPEVPELACRVDFNPFTAGSAAIENNDPAYTANQATAETGFLDYYTQIPTYSASVYVNVEGGTETEVNGGTVTITGLTIATDMPAYIQGSTITEDSHLGWVIGGDKITLTAGPGLLEPMLDTELPPIGIDTIPSADIIGDFAMWEFNTINQWQKLVDNRLNGLKTVIPTVDYTKINGLLNLENARNQTGNCANFSIYSDLNTVLGTGLGNTYHTVSDGTISVEGQTIVVPEKPAIQNEFDAFLDVFRYTDNNDVATFGATITTAVDANGNPISDTTTVDEQGETVAIPGFTHYKFEYIGSVKSVTGDSENPFEDGVAFTLYEIRQGDCIYEIKLGEGGSGPCDSWEYDGPFKVVQGSTTGTIDITGIDKIGSVSYAGLLCIGSTCSLKPEETLGGADSGVDVYANIKYNGAIDYSYAIETDPGYVANVRLARIESFLSKYTVTLSRQTHTTPSTDTAHKAGTPVTTLSTLTETIDQFCPGGAIIEGPDATQKHYTVAVGTTGKIYAVADGVFTGVYQEGGTAAVSIEDESSIKQIHFGDLYADDVNQYYNGPFKLQITGQTTYLHEGDTVTSEIAESVIGAPTAGTVVSADRTVYTVRVIDGASQIPDTGQIQYAGYAVINGTSPRKEVEAATYKLDGSASTTIFLVGTEGDAGWSFDYDTESGTNAPNLSQLVVDGQTVYGSALSVGSIVGGSTVSAINGSTITAYKVVSGETVYTDYVTPQRYAVALGSASGDDVKQIQYGNIYIDDMGSGSSPAPPPFVYSGPFHVVTDAESDTGYSVKGVDTVDDDGTSVPKAGKIYIDGKFAGWAAVGPATLVTDEASKKFVYANVFLTREDAGYEYSTCDYGDPSESIMYGADTYTVRLAQITGTGTNDIKQFHFGDIYVDADRLVSHQDPYSYEGPFKLSCAAGNDQDKPLSCSVVAGSMVPGSTTGTIYLKGEESVGVTAVQSINASPGSVIYAVITNGSTMSLATEASRALNAYNVRLGTVNRAIDNNVVIDGHTVAISDVTEGQKIGAATVIDVTNGTITYTYLSDGTTATGTVTASTTYSAYQYHYGDIYIDNGNEGEYDGPFKVEGIPDNPAAVKMYAFDGTVGAGGSTTSYIGKILYDTDLVKDVTWDATIPIGGGTVYIHIPMKKNATHPDDKQTYEMLDPVINTTASYSWPTGGTAPEVADRKVYTFRLAKVAVVTHKNDQQQDVVDRTDITQIQYGDIYLGDTSEPIVNLSGGTYTGPFKVTVDTNGIASISCPDCIQPSGGTVTGKYIINGTTVCDVGYKSVATDNEHNVYLQIRKGNNETLSMAPSMEPNVYNVLLAQVTGGTAYQMQYGYIHVDGRWM